MFLKLIKFLKIFYKELEMKKVILISTMLCSVLFGVQEYEANYKDM